MRQRGQGGTAQHEQTMQPRSGAPAGAVELLSMAQEGEGDDGAKGAKHDGPEGAQGSSFALLATLRKVRWTWDILAISTVYVVQGFTDLAGTAIPYALKDTLHLDPAQSGYLYTVIQHTIMMIQVPWTLTPLYGLATDTAPILGFHRKAYLLIIGVLGSLSWLALPWAAHAAPFTALAAVTQACSAWSQVVADSVTVKLSQRQDLEVAAFFQSLSWVTYTAGAVAGGAAAGQLLQRAGAGACFLVMAAFTALLPLCAALLSERRDSRRPAAAAAAAARAGSGLRGPPPGDAGPRRLPPAGQVQPGGAAAWRRSEAAKMWQQWWRRARGRGRPAGEERQAPEEAAGLLEAQGSAQAVEAVPWVHGDGGRRGEGRRDHRDGVEGAGSVGRGGRDREEVSEGSAAGEDGGGSMAAVPLRQTARLLWSALRHPMICGAAAFVFLWQATPSPTPAMFYFQTNVLNFSPAFMEFMYLCGTMSGFLGVLIYNCIMVRRPLRRSLLACALAGWLLNASQLLLVARLNVKLGLSDALFALGDYSMLSVFAELMLAPVLAIAARLCPDGVEATLFASLYSLASAAAGEGGEEGEAAPRPASPAGRSEGSCSSEELDTEALLRAWPTQNEGGASLGQAARAASGSAAAAVAAAAAGPVVTLRDCIRLLHESLAYLPPAGELHHLEYLWQQDHSVVIGQEQVPFDAAWLRPRLDHALALWGGRSAPQPVPDAQTWKCRSCDFKDVCRRHNPSHPLSDPRAMADAALDDRRRQREARRQMQQQQGQPPPAQQLQP